MKKKKRRWDKVLLAIILGLAIVGFWRGAWGLMDEYLFPNNHLLSLWFSLMVGIIVLFSSRKLVERWL